MLSFYSSTIALNRVRILLSFQISQTLNIVFVEFFEVIYLVLLENLSLEVSVDQLEPDPLFRQLLRMRLTFDKNCHRTWTVVVLDGCTLKNEPRLFVLSLLFCCDLFERFFGSELLVLGSRQCMMVQGEKKVVCLDRSWRQAAVSHHNRM